MHAPSIRPRSAIEIVDAAVSLYRDNFKTMAVIGLAASVPFVAFLLLGVGAAGTLVGVTGLFEHPLLMMPWMVAIGVVTLLWFAVIDGAMTFAAAEAYHGRTPTASEAIRGATAKGMSLVGGNILRMLIVFGLAALAGVALALAGKNANPAVAVIVGVTVLVLVIHLMARTFAITSAIVIEGQTATEGVRRSFLLSANATLRIVGIAMLCLVIYWLAQMISVVLVQSVVRVVLRNSTLSVILGNVAGMVIYPFLNIAIMVLYYDQRVRKEGYDLDVMGSAIPTAAPR